jgi:hypothetical protein
MQRGRRIYRRQGVGHALEAIVHGNEDVLAPSGFQVRKDFPPAFGAFGLFHPDAEDVAAIGQNRAAARR